MRVLSTRILYIQFYAFLYSVRFIMYALLIKKPQILNHSFFTFFVNCTVYQISHFNHSYVFVKQKN